MQAFARNGRVTGESLSEKDVYLIANEVYVCVLAIGLHFVDILADTKASQSERARIHEAVYKFYQDYIASKLFKPEALGEVVKQAKEMDIPMYKMIFAEDLQTGLLFQKTEGRILWKTIGIEKSNPFFNQFLTSLLAVAFGSFTDMITKRF